MLPEQYRIFLSDIYVKNKKGEHLSASSVNHYAVEAVRKINELLRILEPDSFTSIYDVETIEELERLQGVLESYPGFKRLDEDGHRMYSAGFNRFKEFANGHSMKGIEKKIELLDLREPAPVYKVKKEYAAHARDRIKARQVTESCNYLCGIDNSHISFIAESTGHQYVEGHHIIPLSLQNEFECNLDCYANIIALCPNCHRMLHYGRKNDRKDKLKAIYDDRYERFESSGILIDRSSFLSAAGDGIRSGIIYSID